MCVSLMARSCQGAGINGPPLQPWGRAIPFVSLIQRRNKLRRRGIGSAGLGLACASVLEDDARSVSYCRGLDQQAALPEQPCRFGHYRERHVGALGDVEQGMPAIGQIEKP